MMILQILVTLACAYLAWSIVALEINYRRASAMGIPLVRIIVDPQNLTWMFIQARLWPLLDHLPIDWGDFGRYGRRGWQFTDKADSHLRHGPIWALVTPAKFYIHVADADAVYEMFHRRKDFPRPSKMYKLLEIYGPCISTAHWADWPRHRKVIASPFDEGNIKFVWDESLKQARQMLDTWASESTQQVSSFSEDSRSLSLNVLAAMGFHQSYEFHSANESGSSETDDYNYRDALKVVMDNCIMLMVMSRKILSHRFAPKTWQRLARAAKNYENHVVQSFEEEKLALRAGNPGKGGLMTSFVRAMDQLQGKDIDGGKATGLTVEEIFGNFFALNFAGYNTTAKTFSYALLMLTAHPEVQNWVAEELRELVPTDGEWAYDVFPKLKRCKAILFETLRLFPPQMSLARWTDHQISLVVGNQTVIIPPDTGAITSLLAVQTHPKYWNDPLAWKPSRWISTPAVSSDMATMLDEEVFVTPAKGTFFPWSDGPQDCPGAKLTQVEFVAVIAHLLREHRYTAAQHRGESWEDTRKRILQTTGEIDLEMLSKMKDADRIRLVCERAIEVKGWST